MKAMTKFALFIVVLFVLLFLVQLRMPRQFVWSPTFYHADRQPFGCYVFDSVLRQSLPHGYQVCKKTFRQLDEEHKGEKIAVLFVNYEKIFNSQVDVKHLQNIARRGGHIMFVSDGHYLNNLENLLGIDINFEGYFSLSTLQRSLASHEEVYDTLRWCGNPNIYSEQKYPIISSLLTGSIAVDSILPKKTPLAYMVATAQYDKEQDSLYIGPLELDTVYSRYDGNVKVDTIGYVRRLVALSIPYGKGTITCVSAPLLFTNYGILDKNCAPFVFRLMSQMADLPVYRTEAYVNNDEMMMEGQSPLREFMKRPALQWAVYLSLLGVILFMLFTVRRRQRVIPVLEKPKNHSLEFIQLIGTLYYQRHDNVDLVKKKFRYFAEEVRRKAEVDIPTVNTDDQECRLLAEKTGMDYTQIRQTLRNIRFVLHLDGNISYAHMRKLIDAMDEILDKLSLNIIR